MPRITTIVNPFSGTAAQAADLVTRIERAGHRDVRLTRQPGDAPRLAQAAARAGAERIIAIGGDGTIHEVVNGLAPEFRPALGIVPLGTGNDFARALGLPLDAEPALERALSGAERKSTWGPLEYLRSGLASVTNGDTYRGYHVRLVLDDTETLDLDLFNLFLGNGRSAGGGIPIAPEAKLDDGVLDVVAIPYASLPRLALLVPQILLGQHLSSADVIYRRVQRVRLEAAEPPPFMVDGEEIAWSPQRFEVLPQRLRVAV